MLWSTFHPYFAIVVVVLMNLKLQVDCHGYLSDPPARTSAWRFGFNTPVNHNDNEMFCGGLVRKKQAGGLCGVCGDPYNGTRNSELGGKWVTKPPTIVATYKSGEWIGLKVVLTTSHKGYYEFRLCPAVSDTVEVTQECLDMNTLEIEGSTDRKYPVSRTDPIRVKLPDGLTCERCVLQWDYTAGNEWNRPPKDQETYRGCADIKIL
ncbi:uncharacterized protein LOC141852490 [Brevipalpus obovatus]|uniref:uncharacterized protein LOC141852490 n=1 Tax=Brevipalpus obovatus TaxID=246614 RepID=UPI003D9E99A4